MEIISNVLTEDMNEEEKMKILSEYIINHMEYDNDLLLDADKFPEKIKKGWGECLYYSVIEGKGICQGYSSYAQGLFTEAGIKTFKIEGYGHIWNLVQIDDEFYFADLTNLDAQIVEENYDNLDLYYLIPIDNVNLNSVYALPLEAEEQYSEMSIDKQEEQSETKVGRYILQLNKQELSPNSYSKFCGIIGILNSIGLVKNVIIK